MTVDPHLVTDRDVSVLVLCASLRRAGWNAQLASLAAASFRGHGARVDLRHLADFPMPLYDQDMQDESGMPASAEDLRLLVESHDAFVLVSPEYNASMPGAVKNALDWLSRFRPQPFNEKHAMLLSASPSMVGGNRGLWALRIPLEHLGSRVYPDMFSLAQAHHAFAADGSLLDATLQSRLGQTTRAFIDLVEAAKHYPCVRSAWIEFLGERPDPAIDRVDA